MSKTAGVVLILGGLGVAAYVISSDDAVNRPDAARQVEVAKSTPLGTKVDAVLGAARTAAEPAVAPSAPVVVTLAPRPSDPAMWRTAVIPRDRDSLARELQRELRRTGCYEGELNGAWTPATRRAMKACTDRLNASLPVDEPDAVLLAMVQGERDLVCGKPCPPGQGPSEDGRCLPDAILAKATRKGWPPIAAHLPASGPPATGKAITGWSTTVTAAARTSPPAVGRPPGPLPSAPAIAQAAAPATQPPAPLSAEGRMALAGPALDPAPPGAPEAAAPAAAPKPPRKYPVQENYSWARMMNERRFESRN